MLYMMILTALIFLNIFSNMKYHTRKSRLPTTYHQQIIRKNMKSITPLSLLVAKSLISLLIPSPILFQCKPSNITLTQSFSLLIQNTVSTISLTYTCANSSPTHNVYDSNTILSSQKPSTTVI